MRSHAFGLRFRHRSLNVHLVAVVLATALFAAVGLTNAAPLPPGGTLFPAPAVPPAGGALIASELIPFATPFYSGTLLSQVYAGDPNNPFGGLTFSYVVANDPTSLDALERFTAVNFTGFLTDAGFAPGSPFAPSLIDRSLAGDTVGFTFFNNAGLLQILPGQMSTQLIIRTNAQFFNNVNDSVIDGAVASVASYGPTIVPEPATCGLVALGMVLGAVIRHKRAKI